MNQLAEKNVIQLAGEACDKYRIDGYHCAESIIRGCAEALDLELPDIVLRITHGFSGGGGGAMESCGLLSSGVALISYLYGRAEKGVDDNGAFYLIRLYHERFFEAFGTVSCREIRKPMRYLVGMKDCAPIFPKAAGILAEIIYNAQSLMESMPEEEKVVPQHE